jgi:hypothetical protein
MLTVELVSELNWYIFLPLKLLKMRGTTAVSVLLQKMFILSPNFKWNVVEVPADVRHCPLDAIKVKEDCPDKYMMSPI